MGADGKSQISREELWMRVLKKYPDLAQCMKQGSQAWHGDRKAARM
jgi:hypothetical protein